MSGQRRSPPLAVVGATGAVGTVMLDMLSTRAGRLGRDPAGRLGPLGRQARCACAARTSSVQALAAGGLRRRRRRDVRRARRGLRASGRRSRPRAARSPSTTPARSGWTPTCRWSCPRSTRRRPRNRPQGHHRQPQLHDADDDRRARRAAPRVRAARARRRLLPGGLRRRARPASTACTTSSTWSPATATLGSARRRRAPARSASWRRVAVPGAAGAQRRAVGRLAARTTAGPVRGAQGPQRVAQDPRPPRPQGLGDLRAGAGGHDPLAGRARGLRAARSTSTRRAQALRRGARRRRASTTRPTGEFPTPADVVGTDPTFVGRLRQALDVPQHARPVRLRRQPAQGRRAQHRADRRAGGRGTGPGPGSLGRPPTGGRPWTWCAHRRDRCSSPPTTCLTWAPTTRPPAPSTTQRWPSRSGRCAPTCSPSRRSARPGCRRPGRCCAARRDPACGAWCPAPAARRCRAVPGSRATTSACCGGTASAGAGSFHSRNADFWHGLGWVTLDVGGPVVRHAVYHASPFGKKIRADQSEIVVATLARPGHRCRAGRRGLERGERRPDP